MDVKLHERFSDNLIALETADAIEACVHCGFCLATCPTYLQARDERDSPRGRIYLIRDFLQTGESDAIAQHHIDRCLTCRSCETTCPSGVAYGHIVDGGRVLLEQDVKRPALQSVMRRLLRSIVARPALFGRLLALGQPLRPLLPRSLREHIPPKQPRLSVTSTTSGKGGRVLLLEGCVQRSATPNTNAALRAILNELDIQIVSSPKQGCCGALNSHLGARDDGLSDMRRNIDAWWPAIKNGVDAILSTATGCGAQLAEYAKMLAHDPDYRDKAAEVSRLACDVAPFLAADRLSQIPCRRPDKLPRLSVHTPCSQNHALGDPNTVKSLLKSRGYSLVSTSDDHLCCGSAGSYSLLQPKMANDLRSRKLRALDVEQADIVVTANVGCQLHLAAGATIPVHHWLELVQDSIDS